MSNKVGVEGSEGKLPSMWNQKGCDPIRHHLTISKKMNARDVVNAHIQAYEIPKPVEDTA